MILLWQTLLSIICLCKPIKILVAVDLQYRVDYDLMTAGYLTALGPNNLNGTSLNTSDFQVERLEYDSKFIGVTIDKIGWACRSGEYQAIFTYTMSRDAKIYGLLCGHYHIPTIGLYNGANILSDKRIYPTFFRYNPSIDLNTHSMLAYIQKMGWKNLVLVVADDNALWDEAARKLQAFANQYGIVITSQITMASFDGLDPVKDYKYAIELVRFSRGKLIYVLADDYNTLDFVLACQYYGLSRSEYTFLIYNTLFYSDESSSIDYWSSHGITLGPGSRQGLIGISFIADPSSRQKWTQNIFNPAVHGILRTGPYIDVDMDRNGTDHTKFYPDVFYETPSLAFETVFTPFDAMNRLVLAWESLLTISNTSKSDIAIGRVRPRLSEIMDSYSASAYPMDHTGSIKLVNIYQFGGLNLDVKILLNVTNKTDGLDIGDLAFDKLIWKKDQIPADFASPIEEMVQWNAGLTLLLLGSLGLVGLVFVAIIIYSVYRNVPGTPFQILLLIAYLGNLGEAMLEAIKPNLTICRAIPYLSTLATSLYLSCFLYDVICVNVGPGSVPVRGESCSLPTENSSR